MNKCDLFIIDRDSIVLKNICSGLKNYPIKIRTFEDSSQAFNELQGNHPRVVIVDNNMPLLNGREFIIKMSQHCFFQHSTVILTTDIDLDQESVEQLRTLGFSEIIVKPLRAENIVQVLKEIGLLKDKKAA